MPRKKQKTLKRKHAWPRTEKVSPSEQYVLRAYRLLSQETRYLIVAALNEYGGLPALEGKR